MTVQRDDVYRISDEVVVRRIEGELLLVPLKGGLGDADDSLYTLNQTGRAIWDRIDGQRSVGQIVDDLATEYEAEPGELEPDVLGLLDELVSRRMLTAVS